MTLSEVQASRHPFDGVEAFTHWLRASPNYSNHFLDVLTTGEEPAPALSGDKLNCVAAPLVIPTPVDRFGAVGWYVARSRAGLLPEPRGLPGTNGPVGI